MIPLKEVIYNHDARGPWCAIPYHNHPHGCPNLKKGCIQKNQDFDIIKDKYHWFAVVEEFDLLTHAKKMLDKHPGWTDRQCRNPLYWQGSVRAKLRARAKECATSMGGFVLENPEASGVDVFETMARVGIVLEKTPNLVRKIMFVGVSK